MSSLVTTDIQAAIEQHIEGKSRASAGFFQVPFRGGDLKLKLVRVHTEYLATLGPARHFACVDLVGTQGPIYDVDFFLSGPPGAMTVRETHVHKINAQPLYTWDQRSNGTWRRVPVTQATPRLLGVVKGTDAFEFTYRVKLPLITNTARMWLPLAQPDQFQTVEVRGITAPCQVRELTEPAHGNKVLFFEPNAAASGQTVEVRYRILRTEKSPYYDAGTGPEGYLASELLVPLNENFQSIAQEVTRGHATDLYRARALYNHVIERLRYAKYGSGWGRGDAVYACDARSGNCSDFHAYFIALARAAHIPARFAIGAAIPSERNDGGIDGYHCWAEFFTEGKWWPVDISEADKHSSLAQYYFGHHPANRIEFSRGRDLVIEPGPANGPINFLVYPVLEIGDRLVKPETTFLFRRTPRASARTSAER
ncbi:MAG: transglutaminase domain-containing protein [Pedosphaera sp.]|nr:transglutaminase domain-containing protein [Pedosphaera sp.]